MLHCASPRRRPRRIQGSVADIAPHVANRLGELRSFADIKLSSVSVDRLEETWSKILAAKLAVGGVSHADLEAVRKRRLFPVKVIQGIKVTVHNRVLKPRISGQGDLATRWPLRLLDKSDWLRQWPARLIGLGVRPEHVQSPHLGRA